MASITISISAGGRSAELGVSDESLLPGIQAHAPTEEPDSDAALQAALLGVFDYLTERGTSHTRETERKASETEREARLAASMAAARASLTINGDPVGGS
jgi:hypothetical protein